MNITGLEYVIFDVETTGLSPTKGDKIIELAAVKVKDLEEIDYFETFINPERPIPAEATRVNNITDEMVANAPVASEILPSFLNFIGGACLVGHNIKFDLDFVAYELSLFGRKLKDETPAIDTLKMGKEIFPHLRSYTLSSLAHYFGASTESAHRALFDVRLTHLVLKHLIYNAADQNIDVFSELYKNFGVEKPKFPLHDPTSQSMLF